MISILKAENLETQSLIENYIFSYIHILMTLTKPWFYAKKYLIAELKIVQHEHQFFVLFIFE